MADAQMHDDDDAPTLFFAGSDDSDRENTAMNVDVHDDDAFTERKQGSEPLFLGGDSDDDDEPPPMSEKAKGKRPMPDEVCEVSSDSDIEVSSVVGGELPRASSVSSFSDHVSIASDSPPPRKSSQSRQPPPKKKQRLSSPTAHVTAPSASLTPTYIGEFLIPNAWANVSGKGYAQVNDIVDIKRDENKPPPPKPKLAAKSKTFGKKQISIATMFKPQTSQSSSKKKPDTIVRLVNKKGFAFGRLPVETSSWIAHLLDLNVVELRGKMTDCPERLTTGVSLIVTVDVYMLPTAFHSVAPSKEKLMFNEGAETLEEINLRDRKTGLLKLFDVIGLKPHTGANVELNKADEKLTNGAAKKGKLKTEIVGDGEEIEVEEGEDLSKGDLDMIYQRAQKGDKTMKEMEPADTFNMTLRGYQKQALCWMQSLESGKMDVRDAASMHPLWSEYLFPQKADGDIIDLTEDDQPFYFNPYSGELSLKFPKAERNCRGGILADEMGMGKTIMLSALIHTSLPSENDLPVEDDPPSSRKRQLKLNAAFKPVRKRQTKPPSATLIVAPTSLLSQWAEEMERSSKPGTAKVLVWHGQNRLDLEAAVEDDDGDDKLKIIVTSYGVLVSEHARSEKSRSPVFELEWLRVVLDEAHACKSRASRTAKAVYALRAQRRWAVTGTPIVNKLEDLFSLLKFINFKPWSDFTFFRSFITVPFLDRDPKAIEVVQVILESVLLRREKNMRDADGNKIVDLPSKEVVIRNLEFSMAERKIYDAIYQGIKRNFERLSAKGLIGKNYTHILAMLMKLRRAVLHPSLVLDAEDRGATPAGDGFVDVNEILKSIKADEEESAEGSGNNTFAKDVLANLNENETGECPICLDVMDRPMIVAECMHQCCKDCITMFITTCEQKGQEPGCPTCGQRPIKANKLIEVVRSPAGDTTQASDGPSEVVLRKNDFESSTKIDALLEHLSRLRDQDPCFRAVVFSQFTSFMDLIEKGLRRERFDSHRYDGSMDVKKRSTAINAFKENSREPKVLVISLKAGGVGLNLTNANHVFMMDCWWNAATENQAIDRVHRLGQDKTVYVTHFIISNTIEGRILQIQKRKTAIVREAFRGTQANGSGEKESVENLKIIFGDDE